MTTKAELLSAVDALRVLVLGLPDPSNPSTGSGTSSGDGAEPPPTDEHSLETAAGKYNAIIERATSPVSGLYWRCVEVRHLSPDGNRGRHGVYVDAVDGAGQRVQNPYLRIGWTWEGRQSSQLAPSRPLDKPDGETGHGMVDIYPGQRLSVWLADGLRKSDTVSNLHSMHADELGPGGEIWNSYGHHSFYLKFQLSHG